MRAIRISILLLTAAFLGSCEKETEPQQGEAAIKVCSFNIRFDNPDDGFNGWDNRRKNVVLYLGIEQPDVIGFQEVLDNQLQYMEMRLTDYSRVGVGRDDGLSAGEFAPIFYRSDRFALRDSGTFWLSETPAVPSLGWDALIHRICTYVSLSDGETGSEVHVYNTHFSHVGSEARLRSAQLIMDSIEVRSSGKKVIVTGDLNVEPGSGPYLEFLNGGLEDSFESELRLGPTGTYNGFRLSGTHDRRIDYIFYRGFYPGYYLVESMVIDNQYLSDHFPVVSLLNYE